MDSLVTLVIKDSQQRVYVLGNSEIGNLDQVTSILATTCFFLFSALFSFLRRAGAQTVLLDDRAWLMTAPAGCRAPVAGSAQAPSGQRQLQSSAGRVRADAPGAGIASGK
jgi:hypothetical protein